jgi:hypothetical protein
MFKAMPISIYTAFYRPYLWEADSLFVRISAIETFLFLILTISFLFKIRFGFSISHLKDNELLVASIIFSLILGFFAGYTSGLFGVLVRFKSPLLPFLFMFLVSKNTQKNEELNINFVSQEKI